MSDAISSQSFSLGICRKRSSDAHVGFPFQNVATCTNDGAILLDLSSCVIPDIHLRCGTEHSPIDFSHAWFGRRLSHL